MPIVLIILGLVVYLVGAIARSTHRWYGGTENLHADQFNLRSV